MQPWSRLGHGWCLQSQNSIWGTDAWLHSLVCRQSLCLHHQPSKRSWDTYIETLLSETPPRWVQESNKYYKRQSEGMTAKNIDLNLPERQSRLSPEPWLLQLIVSWLINGLFHDSENRSEYWTQQYKGQCWPLNEICGSPIRRGKERYKVLSVNVLVFISTRTFVINWSRDRGC